MADLDLDRLGKVINGFAKTRFHVRQDPDAPAYDTIQIESEGANGGWSDFAEVYADDCAEPVVEILTAAPELIRLARVGKLLDLQPGEWCSRCHRAAPNPNGCAICNVPGLGRRLTEALARVAELELLRAPVALLHAHLAILAREAERVRYSMFPAELATLGQAVRDLLTAYQVAPAPLTVADALRDERVRRGEAYVQWTGRQRTVQLVIGMRRPMQWRYLGSDGSQSTLWQSSGLAVSDLDAPATIVPADAGEEG